MFTLITENWWVFLLALIIGLVTAWWIWARYDMTASAEYDANLNAEVDATKADDTVRLVGGTVAGAGGLGAAALGAVKDTASSTADLAKDAASAVGDTASAATSTVTSAVTDAADTAGSAASGAGGVAMGLMSGDVEPKPKIKAAVGAPDNLELIKGVGPKLNKLLISLGVTRFDQIADWAASDIEEVDGYLGNFKGRIQRDNWVDQAGYLAKNDKAGFEAKYGALGSEIS